MEVDKSLFVEVGDGLRLPIGFRFRPTDEELVIHYLKRKIHSVPLPASVIPEHQVFDSNPWDLPGDLKEKRYFFSKRKENVKNCSLVMQAGCGYWKKIGRDKPVVVSLYQNHHHIVGIKKTSVFCLKKRPQGMDTRWIMHQFVLVDSIANLPSTKNMIVQTGDWVVCRIYQQKRRGARKKGGKKQESNRLRMIEKNMRRWLTVSNIMDSKMMNEEDEDDNDPLGNSPSQQLSSPSCSSGVTEILTSPDDIVVEQDQEATSCGSYASSY